MDYQTIILATGLIAIWGYVIYWFYCRIQQATEDGVLELTEVLDIVENGVEVITDAIDNTERLKGLHRKNKMDLVSLCREYNLNDEGTRLELIERLKDL